MCLYFLLHTRKIFFRRYAKENKTSCYNWQSLDVWNAKRILFSFAFIEFFVKYILSFLLEYEMSDIIDAIDRFLISSGKWQRRQSYRSLVITSCFDINDHRPHLSPPRNAARGYILRKWVDERSFFK